MSGAQRGFSGAAAILAVIVIVGIGVTGWYVWQDRDEDSKSDTNTSTPAKTNNQKFSFDNPKKGAHFESSTPSHASVLAAVPVDVVIDFNFDLATNSTLQITKDGKDYSVGQVTIDANKLTMRRQMDANAPSGVYTVKYNGCWPDKTCHDGHFQFAIDKTLLNSYNDMRNQKAVTIKMSQIKFNPMNIRVSPGTVVTWINDDDVDHYVNTDSHPAHSHVPALNSKALAKGASFSFTFTKVGAYPYHCSAHAADMMGNIVVG